MGQWSFRQVTVLFFWERHNVGGLKKEGMKACQRDRLKMFANTSASSEEQALRVSLGMLSGPAAFSGFVLSVPCAPWLMVSDLCQALPHVTEVSDGVVNLELQPILFLGVFDAPIQVISGLCVALSVTRGNYIYLN